MAKRKTIEFISMLGDRINNDDGFTYVHGKAKGGRVKRPRNRGHVRVCVRIDKRSCRAKELRRELKEQLPYE